jgi:hypothetical protein
METICIIPDCKQVAVKGIKVIPYPIFCEDHIEPRKQCGKNACSVARCKHQACYGLRGDKVKLCTLHRYSPAFVEASAKCQYPGCYNLKIKTKSNRQAKKFCTAHEDHIKFPELPNSYIQEVLHLKTKIRVVTTIQKSLLLL